jgi:hypothetical protein
VAVAAAAAVVVAVNLRSHDPGDITADPERYARPAASPTQHAPTPAERAAPVRAAALEACARKDYETCERGLDEATDIDPAGENSGEVDDARETIQQWRIDRMREAGVKPTRTK